MCEDKTKIDDHYDWAGFREVSDSDYAMALRSGDDVYLKSHNRLTHGIGELQFAFELAKRYLHVSPKGKALDVGCGAGYMTDCLTKLGFEAVGYDICADAVALAHKQYPDIHFFVGDAMFPKHYFNNQEFDVIHIREFHPFVRVDDFVLHQRIIEDYLSILKDGGVLIIAHAQRRDIPHLNLATLKTYCLERGFPIVGPLYYCPHKHLRIPPVFKPLNIALSLMMRCLEFRKYYTGATFLIHKPVS